MPDSRTATGRGEWQSLSIFAVIWAANLIKKKKRQHCNILDCTKKPVASSGFLCVIGKCI